MPGELATWAADVDAYSYLTATGRIQMLAVPRVRFVTFAGKEVTLKRSCCLALTICSSSNGSAVVGSKFSLLRNIEQQWLVVARVFRGVGRECRMAESCPGQG